MKNQGFPPDLFDGRPVIGICNTWSELTPCNAHLRQVAERVKRGVYEAGGFPLEFPVMSLGETNIRPTAMLFRNLASMDVEESIRGNPIDGVVLLCGCDKTTPVAADGRGELRRAGDRASPAARCSTAISTARPIGSGTGRLADERRRARGQDDARRFHGAEACMSRSAGHCMTMGTASTMASMVEALGMGLPHNAAIPAVDSRRYVLAHQAGRRIVEMVHEDLRMSQILTREAFENAIRVNAAIGGSTQCRPAPAGARGARGRAADARRFRPRGHDLPLLVNIHAVGQIPDGGFLLCRRRSGGDARARRMLIHRDALTVNGKTMGENTADAPCWNREVIHELRAARSRSARGSRCCAATWRPTAR